MAEIKLLLPGSESGNLKADFEELKNKFITVIKELEFLLTNLDEENVTRAASVYAEHIDTKNAKISNAQIQSLSADKLTAGTIDGEEINVIHLNAENIVTGTLNTEDVTVSNGQESLLISDGLIGLFDSKGIQRLLLGLDTRKTVDGTVNPYYNKFYFSITNALGDSVIYFDDNGDAVFAGSIDTRTDVHVGEKLYINNVEGSSGIYFLSKRGRQEAAIVIDQLLDGINISGSGKDLYINGNRVATESYVQDVIRGLIISGRTAEGENNEN